MNQKLFKFQSISWITHLIFLTSFFVWSLVGNVTGISLLMIILCISLCLLQASRQDFVISINQYSLLFLQITTIIFGYIAIIGSYNAAIGLSIKYSLINMILLFWMFAYLLATPFSTYQPIKKIISIFVGYASASAIIAIAQKLWYRSIPLVNNYVDLKDSMGKENHLVVNLHSSNGGIRPFGLFHDELTNGIVISISIGFILAKFIYGIKRKWMSTIILLSIFIVVFSFMQTRNCFLALFVSILSVFIFKYKKIRLILYKHPLLINVTWIFAYLLLMASTVIYAIMSHEFNSITSRVITWVIVFQKYIINTNVQGMLFGFGISPLDAIHRDSDLWSIDNTLVQVYLYSGGIGVAFFVTWWLWISSKLLRMAAYSCDPELIGLYASIVVYWMIGVFNSTLFALPYTPIILMMVYLMINRAVSRFQIVRNLEVQCESSYVENHLSASQFD